MQLSLCDTEKILENFSGKFWARIVQDFKHLKKPRGTQDRDKIRI